MYKRVCHLWGVVQVDGGVEFVVDEAQQGGVELDKRLHHLVVYVRRVLEQRSCMLDGSGFIGWEIILDVNITYFF